MVYEANETLWRHVQCAAVTDSSSATRSCCACFDQKFCPFEGFPKDDSGYCHANDGGCWDDTCRQLAAGCGASVYDIAGLSNQGLNVGLPSGVDWGSQQCSRTEIESGQCNMCKQPLWCDGEGSFGYGGAPYHGVRTSAQWLRLFFDRDGGRAIGSRQCKWKRTQKRQFLETVRARFTRRATQKLDRWGHHYDHAHPWNEINFYVGPRDGGLANDLWRNLVGLLYVRNVADADDLANLKRLKAHWKGLGREVPLFGVTAEELDAVQHWRAEEAVRLDGHPYDLVELVDEGSS